MLDHTIDAVSASMFAFALYMLVGMFDHTELAMRQCVSEIAHSEATTDSEIAAKVYACQAATLYNGNVERYLP